MTFPLYILLFIYFAFLFVWLIFSIIALYHMIRFGFKNFTTFFTTFIFIAVSILILAFTYEYLIQIDWNLEVSAFEGFFNLAPNLNL